jgi:hypothetical protein
MTALYVIFLGIIPFVALIALFMYYTRHNVTYWWKKRSSHSVANAQPSSYVTSHFCSSVSGCLSRFSVPKLNNLNVGGGNTCTPQTIQLPHGMPHSSDDVASPAAVRVKLEITKTGLISTTNSHIMNTLQKERIAQNANTFTSLNRGHQENKGVVLTVDNLLEPSAFEDVPISKRIEMFMNSNINKATSITQTHIPAKSNISSNITMSKPESGSISGSRNPPVSFISSISKSDQPKKIRKNSRSLQVKVKHNPIKHKLVTMSDSCPSTPETQPTVKFQNSPIESCPSRPTFAELSSKFEIGRASKV